MRSPGSLIGLMQELAAWKNNALRPLAETEGIPLIEEEVRIEKREVSTGRVRVRTTTDTIEEIARATLNEDVGRSHSRPHRARD